MKIYDNTHFVSLRIPRKICPGCEVGIEYSALVFEKNGFDINECSKCTAQFVTVVPCKEELQKAYSSGYYTGDVYVDYEGATSGRRTHYEKVIDDVLKYLPTNAKLLEVGSATGDFLDVVKEREISCTGIEISEYSSDIARSKGHNIYTGTLEENLHRLKEEGFFSGAFLHDVFEHLTEPRETLVLLHSLLEKGGLIYFNTLNVDSSTVKYYSKEWSQYAPPYHLFYPTKKSLKLLLNTLGFKVLHQSTKGALFCDVKKNNFGKLFTNRYSRKITNKLGFGYAQTVIAQKI